MRRQDGAGGLQRRFRTYFALLGMWFRRSHVIEAVGGSAKRFVPYCAHRLHPVHALRSGDTPGNSIFAALGLSGQPVATHRQAYYKSLTSIGSFCLGAAFFSALHRAPHFADAPSRHRRRFVFFLSFLFQTSLILITASLVHVGLVSSLPAVSGTFSSGSHKTAQGVVVQGDVEILTATNYKDLAPMAFLAFQAAGQVALSRVLELNELPTIVLSSVYFDCVADLYSLAGSWAAARSWRAFLFNDEKRALRRLTSIASLVLGGFVGGLMFKSRAGMSGALWLAGGMKGIICISWLFWRSQAPKGDGLSLTRSTERTLVQD